MRRCVLWVAIAAGVVALAAGVSAGAVAAQQAEAGPTLSGRAQYEKDGEVVAVEGVVVAVSADDGGFATTLRSDTQGTFRVVLPAPGKYTIALDTASLPAEVRLANPDRATLHQELGAGDRRTVVFALATGTPPSTESTLEKVPDRVVSGIRFGLIIAVCAVGLSLIFGTTGLVNFAHGEMVTFGALMAFFFNRTLGLDLLVAVPLAVVAGALAGGVFNRGVWRPLRGRGTGLVAMMIVSFGLGLALRNMYLFQFRGRRRALEGFDLQTASVHLGPVDILPRDLWIMGISLAVLLGVGLFLQRTRMGKAMRAVSDDAELAESSGIDVEQVIAWVWISGGALAALGGVFQGIDQKVQFQTGYQLLLLIFAAVVLGGLGNPYGALVGSLVIGLFIQLSTLFVDTELRLAMALMLMILVLMVRPQGILGRAERVG